MHDKTYTEILPNGLSFDMVFIESGEFWMGSPDSDSDAYESEKPMHFVRLSSFFFGKYPVTQDLWVEVMESNPARFKAPSRPIERVSWKNVQQFINQLNKKTKGRFRLPTEAEWEFAARGGRKSEGYKFAGSDKLKEVGWFDENSRGETQEVGLLYPNELGLFDMSGNVWEWCEDHWHDDYNGAPENGGPWEGPKKQADRVLRGGSWNSVVGSCRATDRSGLDPMLLSPDIGFRLVRSL